MELLQTQGQQTWTAVLDQSALIIVAWAKTLILVATWKSLTAIGNKDRIEQYHPQKKQKKTRSGMVIV